MLSRRASPLAIKAAEADSPIYYFPRERDEREFARSRHSQKK